MPSVPATARSEAELVRAAKRGERHAAEALVDRSYDMVYRTLLKLCADEETACDLTQDAYVRAWSAIGRFEGRAKFSTWMYRIAYTTFLNHVRKPKHFQDVEPEVLEAIEDPAGEDPGDRLDGGRLRRAVLGLPEELRFAVAAHFWGDVPVREIARQQGLSTVGVRKRLRRAMSALSQELDEGETS
ncbi:MAG: RNA polymerase sigma factor [Acidobacteriota bacterium]|nr:RNA polymerase sigma factor [Acidobacteriota bacterium]